MRITERELKKIIIQETRFLSALLNENQDSSNIGPDRGGTDNPRWELELKTEIVRKMWPKYFEGTYDGQEMQDVEEQYYQPIFYFPNKSWYSKLVSASPQDFEKMLIMIERPDTYVKGWDKSVSQSYLSSWEEAKKHFEVYKPAVIAERDRRKKSQEAEELRVKDAQIKAKQDQLNKEIKDALEKIKELEKEAQEEEEERIKKAHLSRIEKIKVEIRNKVPEIASAIKVLGQAQSVLDNPNSSDDDVSDASIAKKKAKKEIERLERELGLVVDKQIPDVAAKIGESLRIQRWNKLAGILKG